MVSEKWKRLTTKSDNGDYNSGRGHLVLVYSSLSNSVQQLRRTRKCEKLTRSTDGRYTILNAKKQKLKYLERYLRAFSNRELFNSNRELSGVIIELSCTTFQIRELSILIITFYG